MIARPWKAVLLPIFFLLSIYSYSQKPGLSYFGANIGPNADSTATVVTFVVAVEQYADVDSLAFIVKSANEETAYALTNSVDALIAAVPFRIEGNVLYLTIKANVTSSTAPYSTEARLWDNTGNMISYTH